MLDEVGRLAATATAAVCLLVGSAGWGTLGWAWATKKAQPKRNVELLSTVGGIFALTSGIGLVIASWTPQLRVWEALLVVVAWAVIYTGALLTRRAFDSAD